MVFDPAGVPGQPQPLPDPDARDSSAYGAPTPYIERRIDVTFTLGTGDFGEAGKNVVTLREHRCSVTITKAALDSQTECSLRIFGLPFTQMKQLATYGRKYDALRNNTVRVEAGDALAGMTNIFEGTITNAYFDGTAQPNVAFQVEAAYGLIFRLKPATPVSIAGAADVATMMAALAKQMGASFENNGVVAKLRDVYYPGTAYQQASRIAEHAGIGWTLENGMLAIWPRGMGRDTGTTPLITPLSGLKDYPTFNQLGVTVTCLFRPLAMNRKVAIKSSLWGDPTQKESQWANEVQFFYPYTYTYSLESETPNGPWFTTFRASTVPLGTPG